ncbi:MAG TPA: LacI family DNA-binding transcriptional regulator [Verrucomicrobiae bacterium]|nr:LacI family DNA-binding transcriptional regulator [Verrucomicrobiae bacterium]
MRDRRKGKVTMSDIARATGLSPMTVSRVLGTHGTVSDDKRKRVLAAAKRLNYHLDIVARQLRAKHTFQLGVVAPFQGLVGTFYFGCILQGIQQVLTGTDYHISLFDSLSEDFNDIRKCAALCHERRVGGLIMVAPALSARFPQTFADLKMPIIVVGSTPKSKAISHVDVDNYGGAYAMTEHIIHLGHTKIGFIGGRRDLQDALQRELGFRKAMKQHGIPVQDEWVTEGEYETRKAFHISMDLLAKTQRPTAIFAANDLMAYGVIDAARMLGIKVPDDLSVAGFDDLDESALCVPSLTTVAQPMLDLGRVAARYLLDVLNSPKSPEILHTELPARLVPRSSTAAPGGGRSERILEPSRLKVSQAN